MDARLNRAQAPTRAAAPKLSPATGPNADAMLAKGSDDPDGHFNISHLIEGLRPDSAPPPTVSRSEDQGGDCRDSEAALEKNSSGDFPSRDQESTATAPFHSQDWGGKGSLTVPS